MTQKFLLNSVIPLFVTHSFDEATGSMDSGYPRSIEEDFPGMGDEVDAAVYHYGIIEASNIHISILYLFFPALTLRSLTDVPLPSLSGYLYFFHEHMRYEYSYTSRKVIRIMRANSILNC